VRSFALIIAFFLPVAATVEASGPESAESRWTFSVYLDDSEIGYHDYRLVERSNGVRRIEAKARFDVKFLFINAFRYRHEIEETWDGDCLTEVYAQTNSNGKKTRIAGELTDNGFFVETGNAEERLGECVMTFAYWNPEFLNADRLLNPQTGEFLDVEIVPMPSTTLNVDGHQVEADCYEINARELTVRVWYSQEDQRWLALESPTKGGRILRYELKT
jgi:hypothetical protein